MSEPTSTAVVPAAEKPKQKSSDGPVEFIADFIKDVSVGNLLLGAVIGAAAGAALSFVNQTLVNPPKELSLPLDRFDRAKIDFLKTRAPDLLYAIDDFYSYRRFVHRDESLEVFDKQAQILIDNTIYVVAIYQRVHALRAELGFCEEFMQQYARLLMQARRHFEIAIKAMRTMPMLLTNSKMIQTQHSFNYLFSLFEDRFYQLWLLTSGVRE
jgi:hypothetical protein